MRITPLLSLAGLFALAGTLHAAEMARLGAMAEGGATAQEQAFTGGSRGAAAIAVPASSGAKISSMMSRSSKTLSARPQTVPRVPTEAQKRGFKKTISVGLTVVGGIYIGEALALAALGAPAAPVVIGLIAGAACLYFGIRGLRRWFK